MQMYGFGESDIYIYMVMWNVHAVKWMYEFENEKNIDSVIRMPDLVMQIWAIGNVRIRARWIGPYAWRSVRTLFRGGRGELRGVSQPISWVLMEHSPNVRNLFAICLITFIKCLQHVGYLYVTFSQNKRVVFALQKYGFWRAKRGFLMDKNRVLHL